MAREAARVAAGDNNDPVRLLNLRKVYRSGHVAVKDLSFSVPEGQVFGFLGVNGAGKTTTMKILTADHLPTSGTAYLGGLDIATNQREVRAIMGYCPQFDALLPTLTAREHLTLYSKIKGVYDDEIPEYVEEMLTCTGLTQYADQQASQYSGGTKRKLSVGIALVGSPTVLFLDEPSTGMDPVSRRFMWDLISRTMSDRSVILTTHSMEECQALCERLGILVAGRLLCIGSPQHLKHRFGSGYQIEAHVRGDEATQAEFKAFIAESFGNAQLLESHGNNLKYRVNKDNTSLGAAFRLLETNREHFSIQEYSISETSLEQIFLQFAKLQDPEE